MINNAWEAQRRQQKTMTKLLFWKRWQNKSKIIIGDTPTELVFDEEALESCFESKAGITHYMKVNKYHDGNVALLGDAAHGMYSLLGQGCATGLNSALIFEKSDNKDVPDALEAYSSVAVPEAHAITDLNLVSHSMRGNIIEKFAGIRFFSQMIPKLFDPSVSFTEIYEENRRYVSFSKRAWKRERLPIHIYEV
mmetsp:Transcript_7706/g.9823  ORF Transcript_7706/g.9823 Transcript_7706/m.9823 type:complete len:194 (+) Transcript_7706:991-1572(+)